MARGVNKVILVGNLGKDPETRMTADGRAVSNITVATSKSWNDKESGEQKERTEWHRVVFFNRLAEIVDQYLRKGSKVYIEGELQTRDWERDGQKHYTTEIVAREMQMLDSKGAAGSDFSSPPSGTSAPKDSSPPSSGISTPDDSSPPSSGISTPDDSSPPQDSGSPPADDFDDDIPF